jgi:carbamoyl-phosphate synthase small subunit
VHLTLPRAILALANGVVFNGFSIGGQQCATGELVFNTSMTGYQEILTDPSYTEQLVTLTYPHIGNYGINLEDLEGKKIHALGLVIKNIPVQHSNFRANLSLTDYLKQENIPGIAGIDTRALSIILRDEGAQNAALIIEDATHPNYREFSEAEAIRLAREYGGLIGANLAKVVSAQQINKWHEGIWQLGQGHQAITPHLIHHKTQNPIHIVAYDLGIKTNILRLLAQTGAKITVVPYQTSAEEVLAMQPDGVFLSNGPGDPAACHEIIEATKVFLAKKLPLFGICLGHQILGIALGGSTRKMKFGHHGANHPVKNVQTHRVYITSQNHGFEVDGESAKDQFNVTHISLFDGSTQGIRAKHAPAFGFQGHPEASPGPHDIVELFDEFIAMIQA